MSSSFSPRSSLCDPREAERVTASPEISSTPSANPAIRFVDLLAQPMAGRQAPGPEFGALKHQVVVGLDDYEASEDTLQTSTSDLAPARLDGAKTHFGDGHERHDDGSTVDSGPIADRYRAAV